MATRQLTQPGRAIRLTVTPSSQRAAALGRRRPLRVHATKGDKEGKRPSREARRPVRIVLVRHGESEGNVDEHVYRRTPDHRVQLTAKGHAQALKAGQALKELMGPEGRAYFYVSPYVRTLQTAQDIGSCLERDQIAGVREEPRMREQDFGNLQDDRMPVTKMQRNAYGRFFFRFPDGESAADVYDRVTGFRETLRQDLDFRFAKQDPDNLTLVIVTHGISLRVFLMRWYKYDFEQFEMLHNPKNSELVVMTRGKHDRYSMLPFHGEEWLRGFGLDDLMIQDQKWQQNAKLYDLNEDWPTSSPTWFDNLGERIEGILAQEAVTQTRSGAQSPSAESASSKWPRGSDPMLTIDEVLRATGPDSSSEKNSTSSPP